MTDSMELPNWDEMSDRDKGAALMHAWARQYRSVEIANERCPAQYFDDPALLALDATTACEHAVRVTGSYKIVEQRLGAGECNRLYDLGLAAEQEKRRPR